MKGIQQLFVGLLVAAVSIVLVLGASALALAEGGTQQEIMDWRPLPSPTEAMVAITPRGGSTEAPTIPPTLTLTQVESTTCPAPDGWVTYTVMGGDDLSAIANRVGASTEQILQANCLISASLLPGTILYLPYIAPTNTLPAPTAVVATTVVATTVVPPTSIPCGPPPGWVLYTVQPNDNLFRLSQSFGVSVYQLQVANCLRGTTIQVGMRLYVPNVVTRTPVVTATQIPMVTETLGEPTAEVTQTADVTPLPTSTPSQTPLPPTATNTPEPTATTAAPTVTVAATPTIASGTVEPPTNTPEP
jgi:LysM repeat protein